MIERIRGTTARLVVAEPDDQYLAAITALRTA